MLKRRTKSLFISSSPRAKSHAETAAAAASSPTKMNESKQGEKEKAARVRGEVANISFSVCQQKRLSSISLRKVRGSPHHLLADFFFFAAQKHPPVPQEATSAAVPASCAAVAASAVEGRPARLPWRRPGGARPRRPSGRGGARPSGSHGPEFFPALAIDPI